jgi:DNA modification methylase/transcriptional regulator with XRE-family HTH domain
MQTFAFGARLFELREAAGLTLRQLASALEIDHTYLSHIESGRRMPPDDVICRIAAHFGQDTDVMRLQAGHVPDRLRLVMQRHPQLTLSLLSTLDAGPACTSGPWYTDANDLVARHASAQLQLGVDTYERQPFARHVNAGKNTPIYNAHSYHTKVPYQGIIPYIEHYTDPGDLVFDPFCGSGMSGVAAILAGRDAVLNDLSPAAVHIARNYVTPCDPASVEDAFNAITRDLLPYQLQLYATECDACSEQALIEYGTFADVFSCATCGADVNLWDHGRGTDGQLTGTLQCPTCNAVHDKNKLRWQRSDLRLLSYTCLGSCSQPRAERPPTDKDLQRLADIAKLDVPGWVPEKPFGPGWEMWRQGHADRGIRSVRDFFTERNLRALAAIRERITKHPNPRVAAALLFAFTGSVNRASKRYQWNQKRPTNVLGGTLYLSSLFYEFNVFRLFERKVRAAVRLFRTTLSAKGTAAVACGSATNMPDMPDGSVDYVFTDPPFGSNIYYADCSLLWEAWLDSYTDKGKEIVINRSVEPEQGGKRLDDYRALLTQAFREIRRVLKPGRWASIVFHSSSAEVWEAVRSACLDAGFTLGSAVMLDKRQRSFKGIKGITEGESVANFDVVLNLQKKPPVIAATETEVASEARLVEAIRSLLATTPETAGEQRSTAYLHSCAIQTALREHLHLGSIDLRAFEQLLDREFIRRGVAWYLRERSEVEVERELAPSGH